MNGPINIQEIRTQYLEIIYTSKTSVQIIFDSIIQLHSRDSKYE